MTIPSNVTRNSYTGTGITGPYPVTFKFFEDADLKVTVADTDGVETVKVLTSDYTVTGAGEQAGGSVTFTNAVTSGYSIVIEPRADQTQDTDIKNEGGNLREAIEDRFDRLCRDDQVQQNLIDRSVKMQVTDASVADAVLPPRSAGALIGWSDDGLGFANRSASLFSSDAAITATGGNTARWISDRFAEAINVRDHGAVGDGVTDDTLAFRSALSYAKAQAKNMYMPPGTYLLNGDGSYDEDEYSLLYVSTTSTSLIGAGSGVTTIKCGSATAGGVRFSSLAYGNVGGFTIDMNGSTGYGLYVGGQYSNFNDIKITGITGTRATDEVISGIAVVIPNSTLCNFNDIVVLACANGVYAGFSAAAPSAPCQFLTFNRCSFDPSTDGFSIRVKFGTNISFNECYVEGAPERLIDLISCNSVSFKCLSGEIVGDYPLTSDSHILVTSCVSVTFDQTRFLISNGAPADKNIFELGASNEQFSVRDCLVQMRENIGEFVKTTSTQDMVVLDNIYLKAVVGGKAAVAITQGAFYSLNARVIQGAVIKPTGSNIHIESAFCDVWVTPGATGTIIVSVGSSDWKIYASGLEVSGARVFSYVPAASNQESQGGKHSAEYFNANSYYTFGNGISFKWSGAATPEAAVTATPGSLCVTNNGGVGALWLKTSGTGNTGWTQIT